MTGGEVGDPPHWIWWRGLPVRSCEGQPVVRPSIEQLEVQGEMTEELAGLAELDVVSANKPVRGGNESGDTAEATVLPARQEEGCLGLTRPAGHWEDTEHTQQSLAGVLDLPLQGQTLPGLGEAGEAGAGQGALPEELEAPGRHRPHRPAPLGRRPPERELAGEGGLRPEGLQAEGVERQVAGQAGRGH